MSGRQRRVLVLAAGLTMLAAAAAVAWSVVAAAQARVTPPAGAMPPWEGGSGPPWANGGAPPWRSGAPPWASRSQELRPAAQVTAAANEVPAGAVVDSTRNLVTFTASQAHLSVVASAPGTTDMTFGIAGLTDPTVQLPQGAHVTVDFINGDRDSVHGWVLTSAQPPFSTMPMMSQRRGPAFAGSVATPLGPASAAGAHAETISFTAASAGRFTYVCPVPGHAQQGMFGAWVVA